MQLRRIASLTLFFSLFLMLVTSVVLYIVPQGRVAYWSDWTLWGLSKTQWGELHVNVGFLMVVAGIFHLVFNWKSVMVYLKTKAREMKVFTPSFNAALVLALAFTVGTVVRVPPFAWLSDLSITIKDDAGRRLGEPPYGHAEESSLRVFLRNTGQDPAPAKERLAAAGVQVDSPETTILALAHGNGLTPRELYEIIRGPESERPTGPLPIPTAMPMGTGRKTLAAFCAEYNRDPEWAVGVLRAAGCTASADQTLKDIAEANGLEALDLLDRLREAGGS